MLAKISILLCLLFLALTTPSKLIAQGRICPSCLPLKDGDFVQRSDALSPGWIGHVGIKMTPRGGGSSSIYDAAPGRPISRAIQAVSFATWLAGQDYWGARRSVNMDPRRVNMLSSELKRILSFDTEYDGNHLNQKGRVLQSSPGRIYFEADCVGFVEGLHEMSRDALTPIAFEEGTGWPLTVAEQRDFSASLEVRP